MKKSLRNPLNLLTRIAASSMVLAASAMFLGFAPEKGVDQLGLPTHTTFKNWGLINSQAKSHIDAPDAWKIEEGSPNVVVAVIDTGIDASHPSLKKNIWHSGSIPMADT